MPELIPDRILMCAPEYFSVDYVINPWMAGNQGQLDKSLALSQWQDLRAELEKVAEVELMAPQPDLPDLVFTANAGFVCGQKVVPSHFMPMERRPEEPYIKQWFRERGFELHVLPDDVGFEGAGDCLIDRRGPWLWTGHGFRTEQIAHELLAGWFDREVVSIRLTDSRFYHIDTCLCPLSGGYLLYYPGAFDKESIAAIEQRVPAELRISVSAEDAATFSCNSINVAEHIFMNHCSDALQASLVGKGFVVHEVPLSEFLKAGGSAKCLTLKISEPEVS
jgi:N-dimethylarginine dimethylaminohydrolase